MASSYVKSIVCNNIFYILYIYTLCTVVLYVQTKMEIELEEEYLTTAKDNFGSGALAGYKSGSGASDGDTFTCHCFVTDKDALFAGRSDGQVGW